MLSREEQRLLYWLTSSRYRGEGTVVDCGPFLGGSTVALCAGLRANRAGVRPGVVHVYDRFTYEPFFDSWFRAIGVEPPAEGQSFLPLWKKLNAPDFDLVTLHAADILTSTYEAGPIEVLFLDLCKSWEINAHVLEQFFPHLIPGRSLIVQQDYVHCYAFWLVLTMDWFRDYFTYLGRVGEGASALFRCDKAIPPEMLAMDLRRIPLERKKVAFERELARSKGYQYTEILVAYYRMMADAGDLDGARAVARRINPAARAHPVNAIALTLVPQDLLAA